MTIISSHFLVDHLITLCLIIFTLSITTDRPKQTLWTLSIPCKNVACAQSTMFATYLAVLDTLLSYKMDLVYFLIPRHAIRATDNVKPSECPYVLLSVSASFLTYYLSRLS